MATSLKRRIKTGFTSRVLGCWGVSAAFAALTVAVQAQPPDSCLTLYPAASNPYAVMLDTCDKSQPAEAKMYARDGFYIRFVDYYPPLPSAPPDSLVLLRWQDIDSNQIAMRDDFAALEDQFGPFILRKTHPHIADSNHILSRSFILAFERYVHLDTALTALATVDGIEATFPARPANPTSIYDPPDIQQPELRVYPNPAGDVVPIQLPTGFHGPVLFINSFGALCHIQCEIPAPDQPFDVNVSRLPRGWYIIKCKDLFDIPPVL